MTDQISLKENRPFPCKKIAYFVLYLNFISTFLNVDIHLIVNCLRNSKMTSKLSRPSGSWVFDQNNILTVLIHNLNPLSLLKISLEFLGQFTLRCMLFFHTKHAHFKLGMQYPLKAIHFVLFLLEKYYKICRRKEPTTFETFYMIVIHISILIYPKDSAE